MYDFNRRIMNSGNGGNVAALSNEHRFIAVSLERHDTIDITLLAMLPCKTRLILENSRASVEGRYVEPSSAIKSISS